MDAARPRVRDLLVMNITEKRMYDIHYKCLKNSMFSKT